MLGELGVDVDLGVFNVVVTNAFFSFANQEVRRLPLRPAPASDPGAAQQRAPVDAPRTQAVLPSWDGDSPPASGCAPRCLLPFERWSASGCCARDPRLSSIVACFTHSSHAHVSCPRPQIDPGAGDPIPAGLMLKADMEFLSIAFALEAAVDSDGFDLDVQVNDMSVSCTTRNTCRTCRTRALHVTTCVRHCHHAVRLCSAPTSFRSSHCFNACKVVHLPSG